MTSALVRMKAHPSLTPRERFTPNFRRAPPSALRGTVETRYPRPMRTSTNTPDRLIIEDRPWFLWAALYGMGAAAVWGALTGRVEGAFETLLVLALGLGMLWMAWRLAPYQQFTFDRTSGTFTHSIRRLGRPAETWERPLADIEKAVTQSLEGSERVALSTPDGPHPLEAGFTGMGRKALTATINDWLGA